MTLEERLDWLEGPNRGCVINPLTTVETYLSHENWPMNWPDFTASPAHLDGPTRNRHTVAYMYRFAHILKWPPELAVWFMSEWRAVTSHDRAGKDICGPTDHFQQFWNGYGRQRVKPVGCIAEPKQTWISELWRPQNYLIHQASYLSG